MVYKMLYTMLLGKLNGNFADQFFMGVDVGGYVIDRRDTSEGRLHGVYIGHIGNNRIGSA